MALTDVREGLLMLEDGSVFRGLCAAPGTAFGEVVFNTSMTGYQEILTDPSYRRQIVVMTQPHIGNYGTQREVEESRRPWAEGFIARRFTPRSSSHRNELDLVEYLHERQVPALSGIDTRAVVRRLRDRGAMRGVVSDRLGEVDKLRAELLASPQMVGRALVDEVTVDERRVLEPASDPQRAPHIALYDFGAKESIARHLVARGARVTVLPARTTAAECLALGADGVMLSNGPGDPEPLGSIIDTVRELVESGIPLFGICLGHQLLGLAMGGRTFKMKFGHHGGNQPVQDLDNGQVVITSQNHGFSVDPESLPASVRVSHRNLNDGTVEGLAVSDRPAFSVQFHPEAAPGPHDALGLFDRFLESLPAR
ncbi:MAG: glutamine-hydrolyzing carbamoyl-phosphate synthase small subunit [Thermoanaerobaculia bacterium]|nr:glutamine-hydrolyzing carbamoyl-phosphate synthase small subunit [Thermoanaerobaculia bacterium]